MWHVSWKKKHYCDSYWRSVCACAGVYLSCKTLSAENGEWNKIWVNRTVDGCELVFMCVLRAHPAALVPEKCQWIDLRRFITWNPLCAHGHNFQTTEKKQREKRNKSIIGHAFFGHSHTQTHTVQYKQINEWMCLTMHVLCMCVPYHCYLNTADSYKYAASDIVYF